MKSLLLLLALLAAAGSCFAQKFAIRKNLVVVDGQPYFQFESDGYDLLYITSLHGERLLVVKEMLLNDPALCSPDNPTGPRVLPELLTVGIVRDALHSLGPH